MKKIITLFICLIVGGIIAALGMNDGYIEDITLRRIASYVGLAIIVYGIYNLFEGSRWSKL